jgi:hypothetical protein
MFENLEVKALFAWIADYIPVNPCPSIPLYKSLAEAAGRVGGGGHGGGLAGGWRIGGNVYGGRLGDAGAGV